MNTPFSDLEKKGFVVISYPPDLRAAVSDAVQAWKSFCALPMDVKSRLPYSNGQDGVGYEFKDGDGPHGDRKENFDVTTASIGWLEQHAASVDNPVALDFIKKASGLIAIMKPTVLEFARQCEDMYGLSGFEREVDASEAHFFVRFIHYFGDREVGEETANAHIDQSGFTLHLYESDPGLQCLTLDTNEWIDMPVSEGETVIINSLQMQLRSMQRLRALWHRVIANAFTAEHGRYSTVCFVQLAGQPKYDKDRNGRLQEREPGSTYAMPHGEFRDLFQKNTE